MAPSSKSGTSNVLAGKRLKIVTTDGPTLEYNFHSASELELVEAGAKAVKGRYGALESGNLLLVSHMIPGTQRGFGLVIDQRTRAATLFEVSFSGYAAQETAAAAAATPKRQPQFKNGHRNREAQRKVWFGYVADGAAAPTAKHTYTNRLEGKGIYWKQDNDVEILEFYVTILYSNFIELTRFGGEMTVCAPADYIMVNDHQFIYSRIECEFSGTFTLQIINLFDMTQKGVRLGLNEKDELEYYLYGGKGEITGQIATFEVFGNNGETRGPRRLYRPLETFEVMTDEEVKDQVINHAHAFGDGRGSGAAGMGGYKEGTPLPSSRARSSPSARITDLSSNTTSSTASSSSGATRATPTGARPGTRCTSRTRSCTSSRICWMRNFRVPVRWWRSI